MINLIQAISTVVRWLTLSNIAIVLFFGGAIAWFGYVCFKLAVKPPEDIC